MLFASNRYGEVLDKEDAGEESSAMELTVIKNHPLDILGTQRFCRKICHFSAI